MFLYSFGQLKSSKPSSLYIYLTQWFVDEIFLHGYKQKNENDDEN